MESSEISLENLPENTCPKFRVYKGTVLAEIHASISDALEDFEVRDDDVWIFSFLRSGTTWTQEMIWMIANDLDFEGAKTPINKRMPFLNYFRPAPTVHHTTSDLLQHLDHIAKLPSPRFINTHLPFHLLPRQLREGEKKCKVVYVSRNPKDACISFYHFFKLRFDYRGTLEDFCEAFMEDKIIYTPYWNHVNGYFEKRGDEHFLFVTFEEMKSDLRSVIERVAEFLGKKLNNQQIEDLQNHLSFANMQKNPAVNREKDIDALHEARGDTPIKEKFIRSGEVGQWKSVMSEELIKRFDEWIRANSMEFRKF